MADTHTAGFPGVETTVLGADEIIINMGPQHPSTHGVLRLILEMDGEDVLKCERIIGYLHRGVEKIAEHRTYQQFAPYVDRMDYVAAVANGLGYCETIEKLLGTEAPPRARVVRTDRLRPGDSVSYGRQYRAARPTWIATIPPKRPLVRNWQLYGSPLALDVQRAAFPGLLLDPARRWEWVLLELPVQMLTSLVGWFGWFTLPPPTWAVRAGQLVLLAALSGGVLSWWSGRRAGRASSSARPPRP